MKPQVIHQKLHSGGVKHIEFTRENWQSSLRDKRVASRWTHFADRCHDVKLLEQEFLTPRADRIKPLGKPLKECGVTQATTGLTPRSGNTRAGSPTSSPPLLLVDVMNLVFRSHFAFHHLTNDNGAPTGTYYGFLKAVLRLRKRSNQLVFCWDNGVPGDRRCPIWRRKLFPQYKAKRKESGDTHIIFGQLPILFHTLRLLGWPNVGIPGLEADDLIAILTGSQQETLIYSTDMDLYQLLDGRRVRVLHPPDRVITQGGVEGHYGITIDQWPAYLALGGDRSDNIRVLDRVGPQTALKLLKAGARPELAWAANPSHFRNSYPKYEPQWEAVRAAHRVARIPQSLTDPVIAEYTRGWSSAEYHGRILENVEDRLRRFTAFCAEFRLREFIGVRREFFK